LGNRQPLHPAIGVQAIVVPYHPPLAAAAFPAGGNLHGEAIGIVERDFEFGVGVGGQRQKLQKNAPDNIEFLGWQTDDDVLQLYRSCRLLVFPGEEDFGIVPLEAQACGRPVVAFGRGGALETVAENISGIFFEEQSPECLIDAIRKCAARDWNPAAIRARSRRHR